MFATAAKFNFKHPYLPRSAINVVFKGVKDRVVDENKINTIYVTVEIPDLHVLQQQITKD